MDVGGKKQQVRSALPFRAIITEKTKVAFLLRDILPFELPSILLLQTSTGM